VQPDLSSYVALSAVMFFIGAGGVIVRRNPLIVLMSIELMLTAANNAGHVFVFLVVTVAAAEAAIGLAIVVAVFRSAKNVDVDEVARLRG
jgi:NADH-quinone oxidoreductase subunit K